MAREIPLTRGYVAIVDDEDYRLVSMLKWCAAQNKRQVRAVYHCRSTPVGLGAFLLAPPIGMVADHINGDTLDNRRANLRLCTPAENGRNRGKQPNRSGFKGVSQTGPTTWTACICVDHARSRLGTFHNAEEAARAYDAAALRLHGEFARLNFPPPHQEAA